MAALKLMGSVENDLGKNELDDLQGWCLRRQLNSEGSVGGFQGRVNKDADSCYSFWIGGTLNLIGSFDLIHKDRLILPYHDHLLYLKN